MNGNNNIIKHKYVWAALYTLLLLCFTLYVVLDTFVITRTYSNNAGEINFVDPESTASAAPDPSQSAGKQTNPSIIVPEITRTYAPETTSASSGKKADFSGGTLADSYRDENITIDLYNYRDYDTEIYVADVTLSSAKYLKTAFANGSYGRNVKAKTSETAEANSAIFAVNGDFYGSQTSGYVLRNGIVYRDTSARREDLVIYPDGSFDIINESSVALSDVSAQNAWQVLSFGPALIMDYDISVTEDKEVGKAMASNPRTAIGIIDKLHYVFVVSDGRTSESEGLSLYELACFMQKIGVSTAYNLDGGGSSTMYFKGSVINKPTTNGRIKERSISDIVYIGY